MYSGMRSDMLVVVVNRYVERDVVALKVQDR